MARVTAVEIRVGNLLEWDKRVWRVLKCYHVHVGGRGGAFMQVAPSLDRKTTSAPPAAA